jgi:valyl-tRNA synthetase
MATTNPIEIPKAFDAAATREKWYNFWLEGGYFHADTDSSKPSYSVVIPPPNVTGILHMGHALNNTLQDVLCRYKRMDGYNVLWMPGTDHAGIATQNVVEKALAKEGKTRHDLGREKLVERIWEWKRQYGDTIINQLKYMGCSCDWERTRFTLDDGLSAAVRKVFVQLFKEGFIYRGDYLVNWCPRCETAISDDEVDYQDRDGKLWYIRYPGKDGGEGVVIATTRPETMLGDTAIAVNPNDPRHKDKIGSTVILPIVNRELTIVGDDYVDLEFGTGALKVTPAHDINDFEIGKRHNLEEINIFTHTGTISEKAGVYVGMDRYECRKQLLKDLKEKGLIVKVEELKNRVGVCYRCDCDIEPFLSRQWFVRMAELMKEPRQAVEDGRIKFHPDQWKNTYFAWIDNLRDWCISRQIWWGHRIPVWYCTDCGKETVEITDPTQCAHCNSENIRQDEDVLDTWFSSALWPFSTMGWPEKTPELEKYYPTSVLVTGHDIIFFWIARMNMMGLKFMEEVPYKDVYITALVRDENGRKMSKSLGNAVDPIDIIDEYGADAMRFTLSIMAAQGRSINLDLKRTEGYRNFINKLWNAFRLVFSSVNEENAPRIAALMNEQQSDTSEWCDRWIASRLQRATREVRAGFDEYRFNDACNAAYHFMWHEYCDWYLELLKPRMYSDDSNVSDSAMANALSVLRDVIKMLHPVVPFVTEEIWQTFTAFGLASETSIMEASYPTVDEKQRDMDLEGLFEEFEQYVYTIRNLRGEIGLPPSEVADVVFAGESPALLDLYPDIARLAKINPQRTIISVDDIPSSSSVGVVAGTQVVLRWTDEMKSKEIERLNKNIEKLQKDLARIEGKLSNEKFTSKAPEAIVQKERDKADKVRHEYEVLRAKLAELSG